ncbi:AAA domain-containing protein [Sphingobacterium allocomposti]|uniref:AAA domain-containing protein n=1 Tax=Sphingobacterium allocomposti TaxID=415956 RepID=A0A5S5DL91_9SPHI|nr:AAA family ATPase [Sphingobacterium composti Yoo et al. 2007 non Ten et al. 2007]TYP96118.1 AAA domain-containing protein [Sphingobacterium composti Yoo et al. 2007 non Ten et al. 2007]
MIERELNSTIQQDWDNRKAIVLTVARQVGKTTLITQLVENKNVLYLNGDDPQTRLTFDKC